MSGNDFNIGRQQAQGVIVAFLWPEAEWKMTTPVIHGSGCVSYNVGHGNILSPRMKAKSIDTEAMTFTLGNAATYKIDKHTDSADLKSVGIP